MNLGFLQITKGPPITQEIPSILWALCQRPGTKSKYKFLNYTQSPLMLFPLKGCSFWSCRGEGGGLEMFSSKPVLPRGFYKSSCSLCLWNESYLPPTGKAHGTPGPSVTESKLALLAARSMNPRDEVLRQGRDFNRGVGRPKRWRASASK